MGHAGRVILEPEQFEPRLTGGVRRAPLPFR